MGFGQLREKPTPRHSPSNPFANNDTTKTRQPTRAATPEGPVDSPGNPFGPLANGELPGAYPLTERKPAPRKSPTIQMKPKKKKSTDMRFLQEPSTSALFSALKPTLLFMEAHRIYRERVPEFNPIMSARKDASVKSNTVEAPDASSVKSKRKASPAPNVLRSLKQPPAKRRISDTRPTATELEPLQKVTTNERRNQTASSRTVGALQDTKVPEHKYSSSERGVHGNTASKIAFNQKSASNRSNDSRSGANTASSNITDSNDSQPKFPTEDEITRSILEVARETGQRDLLALGQGLFLDGPHHLLYMEQLMGKSVVLPWLLGALRQEYRLRHIQKKLTRPLRDEELECINQACVRATYLFMNSGEDVTDSLSWKQFIDKHSASITATAEMANSLEREATCQRTAGDEAKNGAEIVTGDCRAADKGKSLSERAIDGTALHKSQETMPLPTSKKSPEPQICREHGSNNGSGRSSTSSGVLKQAEFSKKTVARHQHDVLTESDPFAEQLGSEVEVENVNDLEARVMQDENGNAIDGKSDSDFELNNDDNPETRAIEGSPMDPIDNTLSDEDADSNADSLNDNPSERKVLQHGHTLPLDETLFDEESDSDVELENIHDSEKNVTQDQHTLPYDDTLFNEESGSDIKSKVEHSSADEEPFSEEEHSDGSEVDDSEPQEDHAKDESEFDIYEDEVEYPYAKPSSQPSASCSLGPTKTAIRPVDPKLSSFKSQPAMRSSPLPIDLANARAAAEIAQGPQFDPSMDNPFIDRPKTEAYSETIDEEYGESDWEEEEF